MGEPDTFWLTVMNVALGVTVGVFVAGVLLQVVRELWTRWRARHIGQELDRDMRSMFGGPPLKR
jgi:uncharacterized membrane protein YccC